MQSSAGVCLSELWNRRQEQHGSNFLLVIGSKILLYFS
jgi:hypothetical protein